jgi:DNA-binding NarL/FixJ family response regulator
LVGRRADVQVVGHAATAQDAVSQIRILNPDVVLLDIRLDQGTGMDVLKQIKLSGQPPAVIVLTNYAYPQYRDRFLANGADYFFDKSEELDLMLQALDSLKYRFSPNAIRTNTSPTAHLHAQPTYWRK